MPNTQRKRKPNNEYNRNKEDAKMKKGNIENEETRKGGGGKETGKRNEKI